MNVSFLNPELGKWDLLDGAQLPEALILPFFSDERPLRGAAGLCDFRLCGRLSRMLQGGKIGGAFGETTLYPPVGAGRARLPFARLVLFGLGPASELSEARALEAGLKLGRIAARLKLGRYAVVLPGRSTGRLSARRALELYLEAQPKEPEELGAPDGAKPAELVVIESPAGQKEAADLARR